LSPNGPVTPAALHIVATTTAPRGRVTGGTHVRKTYQLSVLATAATMFLIGPALPASATTFGSGTNGCAIYQVASFGSSSLHQATVMACVGVDANIESTTQITNNGASANYSIWAELHRSSDGALVAYHNCQAFVPAGDTYYCTKAWPRSSATVYTRAVVQRTSFTPAYVLLSPNATITP
jgi:hypothetical protein